MIANREGPFTYELGRFWYTFVSGVTALDRNPELILNLGVYFRQYGAGNDVAYDPDDEGAGIFISRAWPRDNSLWRHFKHAILHSAQQYWSGRFWLIPPSSVLHLCQFRHDEPTSVNRSSNTSFLPYAQALNGTGQLQNLFSFNVYCRANIYEAPSPEHAHITFDVPFTPSGFRGDGNFINFAYASSTHMGRLESGTRQARRLLGAAVVAGAAHHIHLQRQYLHEIGHALGQIHIGQLVNDPMCRLAPVHAPNANDFHCYVGNNENDEQNVMGMGERLTELNANPWKAVMANLTGSSMVNWGVSMNRVTPGTWAEAVGFRCLRNRFSSVPPRANAASPLCRSDISPLHLQRNGLG